MEDKLLQAFVIFVSLLVSQKNDTDIKDEDYVKVQKDNERMLKQAESLDQEVAATVNHALRGSDHKAPQEDTKSFDEEQPEPPGTQSERVFTEEAKTWDLEESTVIQKDLEDNSERQSQADEDFPADSDPSRLERAEGVSEADPDVAEVHEKGQTEASHGEGGLQLDLSAEQTGDGSDKSPERPEKPAEKEGSKSEGREEETPPLDHAFNEELDNESSEIFDRWEEGCLWYIWSIFSFISTIRFFRKYIWNNLPWRRAAARNCTACEALLPDSGDLHRFYSKHLQVPSNKWRRQGEFLDGFINDLLGSMSVVCDKNGDMGIEGFQMVDACDIIVSIKPPKSYQFQCLWSQNAANAPDKGAHGQIKVMQMKTIQKGCQCQSPDTDDDIVCLLHSDMETEAIDECGGPLSMKNRPFLSAPQVSRWFQRALKQTWDQISHRYEFELSVGRSDALAVRFRSGKRISFHMSPVVKMRPDAHLYFCPRSSGNSDTLWTLSLAIYEDRLLDHLSKQLPKGACHSEVLKIALFLHKRQATLTGSCALNETHFKTALLHLILAMNPSQWKPNFLSRRLRDLLVFLEKSLKGKSLHHALIGNPLAQCVELPAELIQAKPVNLLHPLVVEDCTYRNTLLHFQELLKNAQMLILEYTATRCDHANGSVIH